MTAQISDRVIYNDTTFCVAGVNGQGLFNPADHGMTPVFFSSACWRGFHCTYAVADSTLRLREVYLGLSDKDRESAKHGKGPLLFGKVPAQYTVHGEGHNLRTRETTSEWMSTDYRCDNLNQLIEFTGGILIGHDFICEMYVHMGFHTAYKYRDVHELVFESGRLTNANDCTAKMAEFREMLADRELQPEPRTNREKLMKWIDQCFSLDYKM